MSERICLMLLEAHEMYKQCNHNEVIVDFNGMSMSYTLTDDLNNNDYDTTQEISL